MYDQMSILSIVLITLNDNKLGSSTLLGKKIRLRSLLFLWGQNLGSDEATAYFGDERHTESDGPTSQGEGTPRLRTGMRQPLSIT